MLSSAADLILVERERRRRRNHSAVSPTFREFIAAVHPRFQFYPHLDRLIAALQRVADGELDRLMVFMPPRHGKSETISRLFPAYYLLRHPARWVALASYGADLAYTLSRAARDLYGLGGGLMRGDASAVKLWMTEGGGGMWATGVGGPATGKGAHLAIVDDPIKDAEQAQSEATREKQRDWWRSTWSTRFEPNAAAIVVATRWHEDDLSGWLLAHEHEEPEGWHLVDMPAIAGERHEPTYPASVTVAADPRAPGEALCPPRYPVEKLRSIARRLGPYWYASLYDQSPRPRTGGMFAAGKAIFVDVAPAVAQRVRGWDVGASANTGDYTVGVLLWRTADGQYGVEEVVRGQWASDERDRIIRETAERDRARGVRVTHSLPQDPGAAGKAQAAHFVTLLDGFAVETTPESGDKATRADPLSSQWNAGNVSIVRAPWNTAYLDEVLAFPQGKRDDQIDATSRAYAVLARPRTPGGLAQGRAKDRRAS
jgi:predicted phage terminase large subunit-like protein